MRSVKDLEDGSWGPPKSSLPLFKIFTSLDETRDTEWTVDEKGCLVCTVREALGKWPDWKAQAKYLKAMKAYKKNPKKGKYPHYEDFAARD